MIIRHIRLFIVGAVLLAGAGIGYSWALENPESFPLESRVAIVTNEGARHDFLVELATNPEQQRRGLMHRTELLEDHGMLFIFPATERRSFWMRNTLIPLDIIFLDADGRIDHIHSMAKPQDDTMITSGRPSRAVLEISGGLADKLEIEPGDKIYHPAFDNVHLLEDR